MFALSTSATTPRRGLSRIPEFEGGDGILFERFFSDADEVTHCFAARQWRTLAQKSGLRFQRLLAFSKFDFTSLAVTAVSVNCRCIRRAVHTGA